MEIKQTKEFEKDIKKISAKTKQRIDDIVKLLMNSTKLGDQLHHMNDVYTIRIENKRLVYQIMEKEDKILLLLFKNREEVYDYLRGY